MNTEKMNKDELEKMSHLDIAYNYIKFNKKTYTTVELLKHICKVLEYDDSTNNLNNDSNLKNQYGADELLKWYELYEKGVITSEELQQKKNEIMGGKEISSIKSNLENNHLSFVFCTNCGARLTSESKFCTNCGERIIE